MIPRLKSITVSNFRSIRGEVTVPLDAPVVLVHGQNGAGKTSILSAIEIGLTGSVLSLGRGDPNYMSHLLHKSSGQGRVALTVDGLSDESQTSEIVITDRGVESSHLLGDDHSKFFTERCYLAQATLGRLLELYQYQDTRKTDSPLTKFVKDLLGLDRLEALIDGLHPAGDVRRLRSSAPSYWAAREDIPNAENASKNLEAERVQLDATIATLRHQVQQHITALHPENVTAPTIPESALPFVTGNLEEERLQVIARVRRDLQASASQWALLVQNSQAQERTFVETDEAETRAALGAWRLVTGEALEAIHQELRSTFPDLPSPSVADPELARSTAYAVVDKEIQRCSDIISRDASDESRILDLDQSIEQAKARTAVLDIQIAESAGFTEGLTQLLAQLAIHIHTDNCPICGRDYGEISSSPLRVHVSDRIASLTEQAARLQSLASDKGRTASLITTAERERAEIINRRLVPEKRDSLKTRRARLEELKAKLHGLKDDTAVGVTLQRRASETSRRLSDFRGRDERSTSLRLSVGDIAQILGQLAPGAAEPLDSVLGRLSQFAEAQETLALERQRARRAGIEDIKAWEAAEKRRSELGALIQGATTRLKGLRTAKAEADRHLESAKDLARRARETRTEIVRRVFNQDLNKLWRDLFIRLAPEEPFVPAFALPDTSGGSVEAILETLHRAGGKGGNPRAMLSAGNLNTAALTLFLSLHLAVKPTLPWLIIDDPVQSMDEVHISQFAALLRTLAKQQKRQLVIAVHERPLFEYLALELSPAFPEDRLITIELGRAADGTTTVEYEPKIYIPDRAIAA